MLILSFLFKLPVFLEITPGSVGPKSRLAEPGCPVLPPNYVKTLKGNSSVVTPSSPLPTVTPYLYADL